MKSARCLVVVACLLGVGCSDKEAREDVAALKKEVAAMKPERDKETAALKNQIAALKKQISDHARRLGGTSKEGKTATGLRAMAECLASVPGGSRRLIRRCGKVGLK
jgi:hypothetical protein